MVTDNSEEIEQLQIRASEIVQQIEIAEDAGDDDTAAALQEEGDNLLNEIDDLEEEDEEDFEDEVDDTTDAAVLVAVAGVITEMHEDEAHALDYQEAEEGEEGEGEDAEGEAKPKVAPIKAGICYLTNTYIFS